MAYTALSVGVLVECYCYYLFESILQITSITQISALLYTPGYFCLLIFVYKCLVCRDLKASGKFVHLLFCDFSSIV